MKASKAVRGLGKAWQILLTAGIIILSGFFLSSCRDKGVNNDPDAPLPTGDWQLHLIHSGIALHNVNEVIKIRVFDPDGHWPNVNSAPFSALRVAPISLEGQSVTSNVFVAPDTLTLPNGSVSPLTYISADTTLAADIVVGYLINITDTLARDSLVILLNPDF
jgi:hypothetical protein